MSFFGKQPLVGLDLGSATLKAVSLAKKGDRFTVKGAAISATPAGAISGGTVLDTPAVADSIRKLCRKRGLGGKVAMALSGQDIFITRLKAERSQSEPLRERLRAEASNGAPFPLDQAVLDYHVLDNFSHSTWVDALVVAAPPGRVERLVELLKRAHLALDIVDATPCALANAFQVNYEPDPQEVTALVHAGASTITLVVLRGSVPLLARDIPLEVVARGQVPFPQRVEVEIERIFERLDEIADDHPLEPRSNQVKRVFLSGGGAKTQGLGEVLQARIRLPFELMNPFRKLDFQDHSPDGRLVWDHLHCMPVAVGLAMRAFDGADAPPRE